MAVREFTAPCGPLKPGVDEKFFPTPAPACTTHEHEIEGNSDHIHEESASYGHEAAIIEGASLLPASDKAVEGHSHTTTAEKHYQERSEALTTMVRASILPCPWWAP